ncbi:hypothetical protein KEM60_00308 [Austwickia sp. TVS 96-490-7B]|nr:hypothetical protein [Austwickia sp. TVS 96-490-7B]
MDNCLSSVENIHSLWIQLGISGGFIAASPALTGPNTTHSLLIVEKLSQGHPARQHVSQSGYQARHHAQPGPLPLRSTPYGDHRTPLTSPVETPVDNCMFIHAP